VLTSRTSSVAASRFGGPLPRTPSRGQPRTCARVAKAIYGQQAGAAAVVMVNNAAAFAVRGGRYSNPDTGESVTVTIPFSACAGRPRRDV